MKRHFEPTLFDEFPKIAAWTQALIELDALKTSAVPDLEERILQGMKDGESYLVGRG